MAAPTVRAVGGAASNTTAIAPGLPAGTVAGDLLLMFLETHGGEAITVSGWTQAPSSPQESLGAGEQTRLTIFYKIAAGGDATTTSDSGDHQIGRILGITAGTFDSANPFNVSAGDVGSASATQTIPGATTTVDDCLVVVAACSGKDANSTTYFSGWTNADLTSLTERVDNMTAFGGGGGIGVATGIKASAGAYAATTVTMGSLNASGHISLAIAPAAAASLIFNPASPTIYRL